MPVKKYRSVEAMKADRRWLEAGDPMIIRKITYMWDAAERLMAPPGLGIPRGVRKYRSIEAASADREAWEQERVDRIRDARGRA